jgi:ElaB/YqjD/DUF883 family membrane-anchored ribosome-binding protein
MNTSSTGIEHLTEHAKSTAANLVGKVERSAEQISEKAGDIRQHMNDDSDEVLRGGARRLKEGSQAVKNAYDRFGNAACDFIAEKPVTAIAIGALAGFALAGIALGRRR